MARSPKGLIENKLATPEEMAQLGIRWEQISAGVFQLRGPDIRQRIKNLITHLRQRAESYIEANPATDGTLDRTAAAKAVLYRLRVIECFLAAAECNGASEDLYQAVYHSLLLVIEDHQLDVIDNETPIVAWRKSVDGARGGGRLRSEGIRTRDREMALEFLSRRGGNLRDSALKMQIGAARRLKRRAAINAVERGLRDLLRQQVTSQDHVNPTGSERELSPSLDCQGPQARGQKPGEIPGGCLNSETRGPRTV
jgi:hypothetical protein